MIWALLALALMDAGMAVTAVVLAIRNGGLKAELGELRLQLDDEHDAAVGWKEAATRKEAELVRWKTWAAELEEDVQRAQRMAVPGGEPGAARDALLGLLQGRKRPDSEPGRMGPEAVHGEISAGAADAGRGRPFPMPD